MSYKLKQPDKDSAVAVQLMEASGRYPRFGCRRIAIMTGQSSGRVWRLWNRLGLSLPKRRPRKRRCGVDIRVPGATQPNGVWTYDFVHDRLARSMKQLIETIESFQDRGIGLKSLQDPIDTSSSSGKLVFHIFAALAEFERGAIRERTTAGLRAARERGRVGGRPPSFQPRTFASPRRC
jgi:hypothetical protein